MFLRNFILSTFFKIVRDANREITEYLAFELNDTA